MIQIYEASELLRVRYLRRFKSVIALCEIVISRVYWFKYN